MTKKQNQILEAALQLFSEEGYHATSTSKVAKKANVSEGLIFRHFLNKEGLLEGILKECEQGVNMLFLPILNEEDPKQVIKKTLEMLKSQKMRKPLMPTTKKKKPELIKQIVRKIVKSQNKI